MQTHISVIDTHTGGEPTRVVTAGGPELGAGTMSERLAVFRDRHDTFRSAVVNEPRGSDVMVAAILLPPVDPACAAGVIFFNNIGYLGMCGHGTIGVAVALAYLGRIGPGSHRLETPVGPVTVTLDGPNTVTIDNVESYRLAKDMSVTVPGLRTYLGDVAWGGNWFYLVQAHGEALNVANVERLTDVTWRIRQALKAQGVTGTERAEIDHIELFGPPSGQGADSKNFVLCPGKAYDRSPCGTGTSAKLACLTADGKLHEGDVWRQESITGSIFEGSVRIVDGRIRPRIRGSAYVNAESTLIVDPADTFGVGHPAMTTYSTSRHVMVIGGGVVGTSCAYFLLRSGWQVTLIERGLVGRGSSHGNCGLICPSHVLPLAEPGMVARGLKSLFERNSAFAIKPRLDPALWSWLLHFAARCNEHDMIEAGRGIQPLLLSSMALYRDMINRESLDCEFETRGLLFAYRSSEGMRSYAATDRLMAEAFHCPARKYDGDALLELEPALKPGLAGGWYYHDDAHLRPDKLMLAWRRVLEANGATIRENCAFQGFQFRNGRARAANTAGGELSADVFVVAAGAWTPLLNTHIGCRVPIQPGKGYSLTMPRPAICPKVPLVFPETRVAATPFQSGYRLGSTMEFAGYDESIRPQRLELLKDGASGYLKEPHCEPVLEEWFGWRPMTYDGLPIIDRSPKYENVMIAAGHNMLGLSMAPATGKLVAELVEGTSPHIDPRPYRASRF